MKVRVSAIIEEDKRVLFMQYNYPRGQVFCLPGGGVHVDETTAQALVREFQEELKVDVRVGPLAYVGDMLASPHYPQTLHIVFRAEIRSGKPELNPKFTTAHDVVWLPIDDLNEKILYPSINEMLIEDFQAGSIQAKYLGDCLRRSWL